MAKRAAFLLTMAVAFTASGQTDVPSRVGVWAVEEMRIAARSDGWVEMTAVPWTVAYNADGLMRRYDRFTPSQVRSWLDSARAFIARAPHADTSVYSPFLAHRGAPGGAVLLHYSKQSGLWSVLSIANGWLGERREPPLALLAVLDSAAAEAARGVPVPISTEFVDPSQTATVPAMLGVARPFAIDSARMRGERTAPLEVVMRYFVRPSRSGDRIDTAATEFDPPLSAGLRAQVNTALAKVTVWPVAVGGQAVRSWAAYVFRFIDPTDSAEAVLLRTRETVTRWVPRNDGRVQLFYDYPRQSEVFDLGDLTRWIAVADSILRLHPEALDRSLGWGMDQTPTWLAVAGRPSGTRVGIGVVDRLDRYPALGFASCGGDMGAGFILNSDRRNSLQGFVDEARKAVAIASRRAASPIEPSRIHGERELTCPARRLDSAFAAVTDESIRQTLSLDHDALTTFVIDPSGSVNPASVHLFGAWPVRDSARIAAAVSRLRFTAPRIGGVGVPMRGLYVIPARDIGGASPPVAQRICLTPDSTTFWIESTTGTVPRDELQAVGSRILSHLRIGKASFSRRPFELEAQPSGQVRAFRFLAPPIATEDSLDVRAINESLGREFVGPIRPGGRSLLLRVTPVPSC